MSLNTVINIVKGWPSPYIVEASLPVDETVANGLGQGDIVTISDDRKWKLGAASVNATPYIINVDSTDPSTGRSAHKAGYLQVPWGNVQGLGLNNALEIETANYTADASIAIGTPLSAPTGKLQKAVAGQVVVGVVTKAPYTLGHFTYLTFIAEDGKRVA